MSAAADLRHAPSPMATSGVYIVSDDPATQQSLTLLMAPTGLFLRTYADPLAFLDDAATLPPGCLVIDLSRSAIDEVELVRRLRGCGVLHPAIIIAGDGGVHRAVEAMKAGAADIIEKPYAGETVVAAVRSALGSGTRPLDAFATQRRPQSGFDRYTPRERDILQGVLDGRTNKEMARDHGISPRTVEIHRANLMSKSGARSVSELVRMTLTEPPATVAARLVIP